MSPTGNFLRPALLELLSALAAIPALLRLSDTPTTDHDIPSDFLGVNVAAATDPETDAFILSELNKLKIYQVRMDFSYDSPDGPAARLLDSLLAGGFKVWLKLLPPRDDAGQMAADAAVQQRWQAFVETVFERYGDGVETFEIGATPNRRRWSGFSPRSYIATWRIAKQVAASQGLKLAGPNVSDFEPLYNLVLLGLMRRSGGAPDVHSDNLFVERVVEPEAWDHRVLGWPLAGVLKLNLIKKARILADIGSRRGSEIFACAYTLWTSKRLARRNAWPERKASDYLLRFIALAAGSTALRRVYWGPLICSRDGLIHDAGGEYPQVDQVTHYAAVRGGQESFQRTPALASLRLAQSVLPGARLLRFAHDPSGLSLCMLRAANEYRYLAWYRDAGSRPLAEVSCAAALAGATCRDATGREIDTPVVIGESPLCFSSDRDDLFDWQRLPVANSVPVTVHLDTPDYLTINQVCGPWQSALILRRGSQQADLSLLEQLRPESIANLDELRVLRDARNRIWNIHDPRHEGRELSVKLNRVKGIKRLTYRFRPSKGRRHWNNACRMLRAGVATPSPVAFYEEPISSGIKDSWYICEYIPEAFSCREVFAAFRDGASDYRGLSKASWFELLSSFVCTMHNRQIVHRDLSSGNLLLREGETGAIEPMLIDIGRAWIWAGPGSRVKSRHRLQDLIRICYKLNWQDREDFIKRYQGHGDTQLGSLWRIPFHYYDAKQRVKKSLKRRRKKQRR
ncbi:MAG: lipopolysaccharide kinase InaA family protein [Pseudomonadota bacterium]